MALITSFGGFEAGEDVALGGVQQAAGVLQPLRHREQLVVRHERRVDAGCLAELLDRMSRGTTSNMCTTLNAGCDNEPHRNALTVAQHLSHQAHRNDPGEVGELTGSRRLFQTATAVAMAARASADVANRCPISMSSAIASSVESWKASR